METTQVQTMLSEQGIWEAHLALEPWPLLAQFGPSGALANIHCFRLIDTSFMPSRDQLAFGWRPVAVVDGELFIDPNPDLLQRFLNSAAYFAQPDSFGELLLTQFHSFALNGYQGYQVREDEFSYQDGLLIVRGRAYRGTGPRGWSGEFITRAAAGLPITIEFS